MPPPILLLRVPTSARFPNACCACCARAAAAQAQWPIWQAGACTPIYVQSASSRAPMSAASCSRAKTVVPRSQGPHTVLMCFAHISRPASQAGAQWLACCSELTGAQPRPSRQATRARFHTRNSIAGRMLQVLSPRPGKAACCQEAQSPICICRCIAALSSALCKHFTWPLLHKLRAGSRDYRASGSLEHLVISSVRLLSYSTLACKHRAAQRLLLLRCGAALWGYAVRQARWWPRVCCRSLRR